jgi:hypothetical protein
MTAIRTQPGQTYGLAFFGSRDGYWPLFDSSDGSGTYHEASSSGTWSLQFGDITELPLRDADLWEDHDLPTAGEQAYPCLVCYGGRDRVRCPSASSTPLKRLTA